MKISLRIDLVWEEGYEGRGRGESVEELLSFKYCFVASMFL